MKGICNTCANRSTCTKEIGIIFGGCNIDYTPQDEEEQQEVKTA